ncbi:putative chromosome-partitioning protein ParB [Vibrio stylophorae]|uniref:Probable chromosome-partitioning protein ParB n=1 Tax=Vibrio stylophorae TaxID=659351 RepID=A0ABN8DP50_9VIBR|nr:putative chromosome-partitioning protein ParB [Vibrio stylophorae]
MNAAKRGLGKGLDALLATSSMAQSSQQTSAVSKPADGQLCELAIDRLQPGKYQPRQDVAPDALQELTDSIHAQGVIQPLVVRQIATDKYEIIAGERRWRAARQAGLQQVPCIVRQVHDRAAVAMALIENIQREDLNAIEEAQALARLLQEFSLTHQQAAEAVGKSRAAVSNLLRLNNLNDDVKKMVAHGKLDMGHARALLATEGELQSELAQIVTKKQLTVRDTEKLVRKALNPEPSKKPLNPIGENVDYQLKMLSEKVGVQVKLVRKTEDSGKLVIDYKNFDELNVILTTIK